MERAPKLLPGRLERLGQAFDWEAERGVFYGDAFKNLSTGDWGVRYYAPVPGKRPEAFVVRVSNEIQTAADRVPFGDQVMRCQARLSPDSYVAAIFWDCQSARDSKVDRRWYEPIIRQGFERAIKETAEGAFDGLWVFHSSRIVRSTSAAQKIKEMFSRSGVFPRSATDVLHRQYLGFTSNINENELETFTERARTGRERTAAQTGLPPAGRTALGWARTGHRGEGGRRVVQVAEIQAIWTPLLTGLRFRGWTYTDGADFVQARGLVHPKSKRTAWHSGQLARLLHRDTYWTGGTVYTYPEMDYENNIRSIQPEDRKTIPIRVPPAVIDDPLHGLRPVTAEDMAYIREHAPGHAGPGSPRGTHGRPLSGLLYCTECRMRLYARREPVRKPLYRRRADGTVRKYVVTLSDPKWRFECPGAASQRRGGRGPCPRRPLRLGERELERAIWQRLIDRLARPDTVTAEAKAAWEALFQDPDSLTLQVKQQERERLLDDQAEYFRAKRAGEIRPEVYERLMGPSRRELGEVEQALARLADRVPLLAARQAEYEAAQAAAESIDWEELGRLLRDATAEERDGLLRHLVARVDVGPERRLVVHVKWVGVATLAEQGLGVLGTNGAGPTCRTRSVPPQHEALLLLA